MTLLVTDPDLRDRLIAGRRESGADRFDEVWDGVRVIPPTMNDEHQRLVGRLVSLLVLTIDEPGRETCALDRRQRPRGGLEAQLPRPRYRRAIARGGRASSCTHWVGGPDLVIEILSPGDRARDKLEFYARIGTREVLIIDRNPWRWNSTACATAGCCRWAFRASSPRSFSPASSCR